MVPGGPPSGPKRPEAGPYAGVNRPAPPPSLVRARVPRDLDQIVLRSLAKQPELRYQGAAEMVAELRALCVRLEPARTRERPGGRGARAAGTAPVRRPRSFRLAVLAFDDPGQGPGSRAQRQNVAGGLA